MALPFDPLGLKLTVGGSQPQYGALAPPVNDGRTAYTGQINADQYNQPGNVNNNANPANGPVLGPTGVGPGGTHYGPVPYGGWSQLGSRTNGFSGYYPPGGTMPASPYSMYAGDINGDPLSGWGAGPMGLPAAPAPAPVAAPHATEPSRAPAQMWGGGFGMSDNSAWGNKGDAALLSRSGVMGSLKDTTNQAGTAASRPNATLPGAGSAFGMGGR